VKHVTSDAQNTSTSAQNVADEVKGVAKEAKNLRMMLEILIVRHTKSYRDLKNVFFLSRRFHSVVI
jgi:hypothetical protein